VRTDEIAVIAHSLLLSSSCGGRTVTVIPNCPPFPGGISKELRHSRKARRAQLSTLSHLLTVLPCAAEFRESWVTASSLHTPHLRPTKAHQDKIFHRTDLTHRNQEEKFSFGLYSQHIGWLLSPRLDPCPRGSCVRLSQPGSGRLARSNRFGDWHRSLGRYLRESTHGKG
jgi:hypothetical protein